MITVTIEENDRVEIYHLYNGDSLVVESPPGIVAKGQTAVLRWKLKQRDRQIDTLHRLLREAKEPTLDPERIWAP